MPKPVQRAIPKEFAPFIELNNRTKDEIYSKGFQFHTTPLGATSLFDSNGRGFRFYNQFFYILFDNRLDKKAFDFEVTLKYQREDDTFVLIIDYKNTITATTFVAYLKLYDCEYVDTDDKVYLKVTLDKNKSTECTIIFSTANEFVQAFFEYAVTDHEKIQNRIGPAKRIPNEETDLKELNKGIRIRWFCFLTKTSFLNDVYNNKYHKIWNDCYKEEFKLVEE